MLIQLFLILFAVLKHLAEFGFEGTLILHCASPRIMIGLTSSTSAFRQVCSGCARRIRTPIPGSAPVSMRPLAAGARTSSPFSTVPLAYDLHEPAKPVADKQTSPIIVMHGLFGSKKNNRTISK